MISILPPRRIAAVQVFISPWFSLHGAGCLGTLPLWGYKDHYMSGQTTFKTTKRRFFSYKCKNLQVFYWLHSFFRQASFTFSFALKKKKKKQRNPAVQFVHRGIFSKGKLISWVRLTCVKGSRNSLSASTKQRDGLRKIMKGLCCSCAK